MSAPGSPQAQPSEHAGWCDCPVLAAHAEVQRLATLGLVIDGFDLVRSYVIAALRERHGCRRQRGGYCYWDMAVGHGGNTLRADESVPRIGRSGGQTGQYL